MTTLLTKGQPEPVLSKRTIDKKTPLLIAGLVGIILTTITLLILEVGEILLPPSEHLSRFQKSESSQHKTHLAPRVPLVNILINKELIEANKVITVEMLTTKSMNPDRVPQGAIWASERSLVIGKAPRKTLRPNTPIIFNMLIDPRIVSNGVEEPSSNLPAVDATALSPKNQQRQQQPSSSKGILRMRDPNTGEMVEWELNDEGWQSKR